MRGWRAAFAPDADVGKETAVAALAPPRMPEGAQAPCCSACSAPGALPKSEARPIGFGWLAGWLAAGWVPRWWRRRLRSLPLPPSQWPFIQPGARGGGCREVILGRLGGQSAAGGSPGGGETRPLKEPHGWAERWQQQAVVAFPLPRERDSGAFRPSDAVPEHQDGAGRVDKPQ